MTDSGQILGPVGLKYDEAAGVMGISRRSLERLVATGQIKAYRPVPGRVVFLLDDLLAHMRATGDGATPAYEELVRDRYAHGTPVYEELKHRQQPEADSRKRA